MNRNIHLQPITIDSPGRQPVPPFGGWKYMEPGSPLVDYTEAFGRARASKLGAIPADHYADADESYQSGATPSYPSDNRAASYMHNRQARKNFLQYFVCGGRAQTVA